MSHFHFASCLDAQERYRWSQQQQHVKFVRQEERGEYSLLHFAAALLHITPLPPLAARSLVADIIINFALWLFCHIYRMQNRKDVAMAKQQKINKNIASIRNNFSSFPLSCLFHVPLAACTRCVVFVLLLQDGCIGRLLKKHSYGM